MKTIDVLRAFLHRKAREFRAATDRWKFFWNENLDFYLVVGSVVLTVISVTLAVQNESLGDLLLQGPSAFIAFAALTLFVRAMIIRWGRHHFDFILDRRNPSQTLSRLVELKPGQSISEAGGQALLYDRRACLLLNDGSNPLRVAKIKEYNLPEPINTFRKQIFEKVMKNDNGTFNGLKVRCPVDLSEQAIRNKIAVSIQKTCYYYDRLTNNLADQKLQLDGEEFLNIRNWCLDEDQHLISLDKSRLSDQWGGGAFLITSDQHIIYMCQGDRTAENRNKLAPAGSGSFDYEDAQKVLASSGTFQDLLRLGIFRELKEETGLEAGLDECLHILVGFGRSLYRGGKPEAFGLVFTRATINDLGVEPGEWDFMRKAIGKEKLPSPENDVIDSASVIAGLEKLSLLPQQSSRVVSGPFQFNIDLAINWIKEDRSKFDRLVNDYYSKA